jgi:hypothetical protein
MKKTEKQEERGNRVRGLTFAMEGGASYAVIDEG